MGLIYDDITEIAPVYKSGICGLFWILDVSFPWPLECGR